MARKRRIKIEADGKRIDLDDLTEPLHPYKKYFETIDKYDKASKKYNLISSATLIRHFGSWNEVKRAMGYTVYDPSEDLLIEIGRANLKYFTTAREWTAYAKKHGYPSARAYINIFGNWNEAKEAIGLNQSFKASSYTVDDIVKVAKKHSKYLTSKDEWNAQAKANKSEKLPRYETIIKHIDWYKLKRMVLGDEAGHRNMTKNELRNILKNNAHEVKTKRHWEAYAKKHGLPSYGTFYKMFGSWEECKRIAAEQLLKEHAEAITTPEDWDDYAKSHDLPPSKHFVACFGTWGECQRVVSEER